MNRILLVTSLLFACNQPVSKPVQEEKAPAADPTAEVEMAGPPNAEWVSKRVAEARARLSKSDAGKKLWAATEAHGGLDKWLGSGTIEFEFDYAPIGKPAGRKHTFQRVDLWSSRAVHEQIGSDVQLGYDGKTSWMKPNVKAFSPSSRFWSLTPYYFVGMPFVLADPGVKLSSLGEKKVGEYLCDLVKATYESNVGDSPDDYYIVYLDKESHKVRALRYIVSFPGRFKKGEHSPEKIMVYDAPTTVSGLTFATNNHTYKWDAETEAQGERVTEITVKRIALGKKYEASIFSAPEGAEVEK